MCLCSQLKRCTFAWGLISWPVNFDHASENGAFVPSWHVACRIQWICVKHHKEPDTRALSTNIEQTNIYWPKKVKRDLCDFPDLIWWHHSAMYVVCQKWLGTNKTGEEKLKMLSLYGCARTETKSLGRFTESPSMISAKDIGKIATVKKKLYPQAKH